MTTTDTPGNPFGVAEADDLLREPQPAVPGWSETEFFGAWDALGRVGVFIHAGRCLTDLDLWWAQTVVFLPDGQLTVDRSWGRPHGNRGVHTGNLTLTVEEPLRRWSTKFDGAGELTSSTALLTGTAGGGPAVPVRWDLQADAVAPVWDMGGGAASSSIGSSHTQQTFTVSGAVAVDGADYPLDGVGFNDHSSGARSFAGFGGDNFLVAVFPDFVVHAVLVWDISGLRDVFVGSVFRGGEVSPLTGMARVPLDDLLGSPHTIDIELRTGGDDIVLSAEIQHCLPMTITKAGDNLNGISWDGDDPIVFAECPVTLTAADGAIGFGHLERSVRRSLAPRTTREDH